MAIKSFELEPTRENLLKTLSKDLISRNNSVWQFARFCDIQDGKCSIAIDGRWGSGKTFFVRHTQMLIDSFNDHTGAVSEEERATIQSAFSNYIGRDESAIELQPQVTVYYDAWANDNDADPILSLIYAIIRTTAQYFEFKKSTDCFQAAAIIADFFTGRNASDIVKLLKENDPLSSLKTQKEVQTLVEEFLESLLFEQGNRLIVFIDELDRCKPSYAVQLLERIKHYFSNDRITFVFSMNIDQLQHTIKCYYGEGFDACRYLDRFFDFRIALPKANMERYNQEIGLENRTHIFESVCKAVIEYCSMELRDTAKYYCLAKISAYKYTHSHSGGFSDENGLLFSMCIIVPIIIGLRMTDMDMHNSFISGKDPSPLLDILGDGYIARGLCSMLLEKTETYDENHREQKTLVDLRDKLVAVYEALFNNKNRRSWDEIRVGDCAFSQHTRDEVLKAASVLSKYASYE